MQAITEITGSCWQLIDALLWLSNGTRIARFCIKGMNQGYVSSLCINKNSGIRSTVLLAQEIDMK
ncbi:MAG: hypothetical protein AAGH65_03945 [Pseudomonadota bacterium]